jgi:hypothetical protein
VPNLGERQITLTDLSVRYNGLVQRRYLIFESTPATAFRPLQQRFCTAGRV